MQQDTTQWRDRLHIKDWAEGKKSACGNMLKERRINNQSKGAERVRLSMGRLSYTVPQHV